MADAVSEDEDLEVKLPPKRRRILDPSALVSVPVYSNKVSRCLKLKPMAAMFPDLEPADCLWSSEDRDRDTTVDEDEDEDEEEDEPKTSERDEIRCPSPPESPVHRQSRQVSRKISEIDRKLRAVTSLLSPEPPDRKCSRDQDDDVIVVTPDPGPPDRKCSRDQQDDDVIVVTSDPGPQDSPYSSPRREISLKVRCRTHVHRVPVLPSTPLSDVVSRLSVILEVPPPRLLLLREEEELPPHATVGQLGLGIADIIECVVMATGGGGGDITVRLQSKDRDSTQEFTLNRDSPLSSVFSRFVVNSTNQKRARFQFDGCRVTGGETPAQLDMEDGDIIEVWL